MMLQELMNSIQKEMTSFHVMERRMTAAEIFGDAETWWLSDYPCLPHPGIIKAMLLRLPITIYVHEQPEGGVYNVVRGAELFEGLRHYMKSPDSDFALHRRVSEFTPINIVVFRRTMSYEDVKTALEYIS